MSLDIQQTSMRTSRNRRGQVLVIAIAVMFLLAFVASIFLSIITRNLSRTTHGQDVVQAQYLAEAGIRYADHQLTSSMLGADWRPDPVPVEDINPGDPDAEYLRAGFTRVNQANGRFLLRVSFNPVLTYMNPDNPGDPRNGQPLDVTDESGHSTTDDRARMAYPALGRYIKIESLGRRGVVDPEDPTTWSNADPLRRMLVAYKPIGITDYARFVTNKDRSDATMTLGAAPFPILPPYDQVRPNRAPGEYFRTRTIGPIRVNGDLLWNGQNTVILNAAEDVANDGSHLPALGLLNDDPDLVPVVREDTVAVAGRIYHEWTLGDAPAQQVRLTTFGLNGVLHEDLKPSNDAAFTTANGLYRDAAAGQTSGGKLRGVARLEPPVMDATEPTTGILRYRLLTRETGVVPPGRDFNTGSHGMGLGIYVDNYAERQTDTRFRRLPDEWSRAGTGREVEAYPGSAWRQHLYIPPGAEVTLDPTPSRDLNSGFPENQSQGTIFITRHDGSVWRNENNEPEGYTRRYRYPLRRAHDDAGNTLDTERYDGGDNYRDASGAYKTFQNGVMFFEGNVRIQGKLPPDWRAPNSGRVLGQHLTIVTQGTAYIEGNLLKGNAASGNVNGFGTGLQVGGIAIIARDYVCINTTAHFMRQPQSGPFNFGLGQPYTELAAAGDVYRTAGYSAVNPDKYTETARGALQEMLLLQTAEDYSGGAADLYYSRHARGAHDFYTDLMPPLSVDRPMVVTPGQSQINPAEAIWEHATFPVTLARDTVTSWQADAGPLEDWYTFQYRPYFDFRPGAPAFASAYNKPIWLSRVAIAPLDIRIEAVLYAQEGSFFVIPGEFLNSNPADVRDSLKAADNQRYEGALGAVSAGWRVADLVDGSGNLLPSLYPFFAEPADIRVVVNGAISENITADKDYQTAWARHWGWTPEQRADGTSSPHAGEGLVYMYDHDLRIPLRFDRYDRPLPPMPALPVSPDLVFFGEAN